MSEEIADAVLWKISDWAQAWGISENTCQSLRKHALYPAGTEIMLGPKSVRFSVRRLIEFAEALAAASQKLPERECLRRSRAERRAQRDQAAAWVPSQESAYHRAD